MVLHPRINLGIAVDLNFEGLVVPVIKDVPHKSLPQLARELNDLAQRARSNRLKPDEMTEATYTLSNSGAFGTLITAPIINPPQVAILSTDGVRKKPVVVEAADGDSIAIRPVGVLAQSFDHRCRRRRIFGRVPARGQDDHRNPRLGAGADGVTHGTRLAEIRAGGAV
jgi:2-oxoglutarate dehydrogenase E2 component (dihydrolipoamide succinyltransferase)